MSTFWFTLIAVTWFVIARQAECRIDSTYFSSIYSSTYDAKIDVAKDRQNLFTSIRVASETNHVFVAAQNAGVLVIHSNSTILYQQVQSDSVEDIFVLSTGDYVFFSQFDRLCVFAFAKQLKSDNSSNNSTKFLSYSLSQIFCASQDYSRIMEIVFDSSEKIAVVAAQEGRILLFDISKRSEGKISLLDQKGIDPVLRGIRITSDSRWIILTDYTHGVMLFRWGDEIISDVGSTPPTIKSSLNLYLLAVCDSVSPSNFILTSDNRFLLIISYWDGFSIIDLKSIQDQYKGSTISNPIWPKGATSIVQLTPILSNWWTNSITQPNSSAMALSSDDRFVTLGERSTAIYIVDIADRTSPRVFQRIQANYFAMATAFSKDINEEYLYHSNGYSLLRFHKTTPNLNLDTPNLFNVHRSVNNVIGSSKWRWRGQPDSNANYFISTDYDEGVYVSSMKGPQKLILSNPIVQLDAPDSTSVDSFLLFGKNEEYLAVPIQRSASLLDVYDVSNRTQPKLITSVTTSNPSSYVFSMDVNEDVNLMIFDNNDSIVFADISKLPKSIQIVNTWKFSSGLFTSIINGAILSYDAKYMLLLQRTHALVAVDISDIQNPVFSSKFSTLMGGESLVKGRFNYVKYVFLADGLSGIRVIDMTKLPALVIVSTIEVKGYASYIALFQSGKYALISALDKGQISLIDLKDITSPYIVSTFQYSNESAVSVSVLGSNEVFYLLNAQGIRAVPLYSETYIHTDIQEMISNPNGKFTYKTISTTSTNNKLTFEIGSTIIFTFLILIPVEGIQITRIQYEQYGFLSDLPSWMTFNPLNSSLRIKVVKEAMYDDFYSSSLKELETISRATTIIVQTNRPLIVSDLIFNKTSHGLAVNVTQAGLIRNHLASLGYIDSNSYVTSLFSYKQSLNLSFPMNIFNNNGTTLNINSTTNTRIDNTTSTFPPSPREGGFYSTLLNKLIQVALQNTIMNNPISFYVKASLSLNVAPIPVVSQTNSSVNIPSPYSGSIIENNITYTEYSTFIETNSDSVKLSIQISSAYGKFVVKNYAGVITSTTFPYNEINFEGDPTNLNKALSSKISLFLYNITFAQQEPELFTVNLYDSINYGIEATYNLTEVQFISYLPVIQLNSQLRLQAQVERQFPNGELDIQTLVRIEFSQDSFIRTMDNLSVKYTAYIINQASLSKSSTTSRLRMAATVDTEEGNDVIYRSIDSSSDDNSTGTYSSNGTPTNSTSDSSGINEQQKYISFDGSVMSEIPSDFWLQFSAEMLKFSGIASLEDYNVPVCFIAFASDNYSTSSDTFCVNPSGIPLMTIFNFTIIFFGPCACFFIFWRTRHIFYNVFFAHRNMYSMEFAKLNQPLHLRTLLLGSTMLLAERIFYFFLHELATVLEQDEQTQAIREQRAQSKQNQFASNMKRVFQKLANDKRISKDRKKRIKEVNSIYPHTFRSYIEVKYVNSTTKAILVDRFIEDILELNATFKINGTMTSIQSVKSELLSSQSVLHQAVMSLLARHLLSKDQLSLKVYQIMRDTAMKQLKHQWYKQYIRIDHNHRNGGSENPNSLCVEANNKTEESTQIFPNISFNEEYYSTFISDLEIPVEQTIDTIIRQQRNLFESFGEQQRNGNIQDIQSPKSFVIDELNKGTTTTNELRSNNISSSTYKVSLAINDHLIKTVMIYDAMGMGLPKPSTYFPRSGESLHLHEYEISSVEAFVPIDQKNKTILSRVISAIRFQSSFKPIASSYENRKLPDWIEYKTKQDALVLSGIPSIDEKKDVLIRIFDYRRFIVKQFKISIVDELTFQKQSRYQVQKLDWISKSNANISKYYYDTHQNIQDGQESQNNNATESKIEALRKQLYGMGIGNKKQVEEVQVVAGAGVRVAQEARIKLPAIWSNQKQMQQFQTKKESKQNTKLTTNDKFNGDGNSYLLGIPQQMSEMQKDSVQSSRILDFQTFKSLDGLTSDPNLYHASGLYAEREHACTIQQINQNVKNNSGKQEVLRGDDDHEEDQINLNKRNNNDKYNSKEDVEIRIGGVVEDTQTENKWESKTERLIKKLNKRDLMKNDKQIAATAIELDRLYSTQQEQEPIKLIKQNQNLQNFDLFNSPLYESQIK